MKQKQALFVDLSFEDLKSQFSKACIVIPTYNESKNIIPLLDKIFDESYDNKETGIALEVLVVDDNSPDGTALLVEEYKKTNSNGPNVHLLLRTKKEGLGAAYIHGMKYALVEFNPDYIMEMDADGQHNTEDIYRLLNGLEEGADFVIGSRYVKGGSVPDGWGWHRKLISWCAGTVTKVGLGIKGVKDCSGGFRAIRAEVLRGIDLDRLYVKGYAFQVALLEAAFRENFIVTEVPIHFDERTEGESKMRFSDMMEGWKLIYKVRKERLKKFMFRL